jgi:hypothetical protein
MAATDTFCASCDEPIIGEPAAVESPSRIPCPRCGSTSRRYNLTAEAAGHATATADLSVTTYPQMLLSQAHDLHRTGRFGISVVVAHMACEIAAERSLSAAFRLKGIQYLEEPVLDFMNGNNLANPRNRKLYTALTGDQIEKQPFWEKFTTSATRRNSVIHHGQIIDHDGAAASLSAARAFVDHLKQ